MYPNLLYSTSLVVPSFIDFWKPYSGPRQNSIVTCIRHQLDYNSSTNTRVVIQDSVVIRSAHQSKYLDFSRRVISKCADVDIQDALCLFTSDDIFSPHSGAQKLYASPCTIWIRAPTRYFSRCYSNSRFWLYPCCYYGHVFLFETISPSPVGR